jgi:rhamnosyltransferase
MKISLIIPTLNASSHLKGLLEAVSSQKEKPSEVIIIDSSSTDGTPEIADAFGAKTIIIKREEFDHGGTRNLAAKEATGDILMFMTQDALPADGNLIGNLTSPIKCGDAAASYGRHMPGPGATPLERFSRLFNYPETPSLKSIESMDKMGIKAFFMSNVCSAFKRKEFSDVDGFPQRTIVNEDMLIASRLLYRGYKIAYVPEAAVIHSHNYPPFKQLRRYFDIGVSLRENPLPVKAEPEGRRFLKEAAGYLRRERKPLWVPYLYLDALMRYSGYRLGLNWRGLPLRLVKTISLHGFYFKGAKN